MNLINTNLKKMLVILLGEIVVFYYLLTISFSKSEFAVVGALIITPFLGWIAAIILIQGNFIKRLIWSVVSIVGGYIVLLLTLSIVSTIINNKSYTGSLRYNASGQVIKNDTLRKIK